MTDERLRRSLRVVDSREQPDLQFAEHLHDRLVAELGLGPTPKPQPLGGPSIRRRGRVGWLAVAAVLALGLFGLLLSQLGGAPDRSPPPPIQTTSAAPSAAVAATPSAAPTPEPSPSLIASLDALGTDGLVIFEDGSLNGDQRLHVLQPDLSSRDFIPDQPGLQRRAAWNPDGSRIAYGLTDLTDIRGRTLIWETDAEGSDPHLLSEDCDRPVCLEENDPAYSPDGSRLVFVRTRAANGDDSPQSLVAIRNLESGEVTELEATSRAVSEGVNYHPRWSPDGDTIAYGVAAMGGDGAAVGTTVRLVGPDGENDRQLTDPGLEAGDPEWAPDGSKLLVSTEPIRYWYSQNRRGPDRMHLYTVRPDGSDVRQLPVDGLVGGATWTSSGNQILFTYVVAEGANPGLPILYAMDADGSNIRPVSAVYGRPGWYAVQQPVP